MSSINLVESASQPTSIGTSYDLNKRISIDMDMFPPTQPYEGLLSLIIVQLQNINTATKLTLRICRDQAGDKMIITDTESDIYTGVTTSTNGTAIFELGAYVKLKTAGDLHCFLKTNTGTVDLDFIDITYLGDR